MEELKKREFERYNKFDVVYVDFGEKPSGVQGGIRPAIVVSCDASNHIHAPQVSVVPLSTKLKRIPVHVQISPGEIRGFGFKVTSDFMPEDIQTVAKDCVLSRRGYVPKDSRTREQIDRALIMQLDLLPIARKMIMEEMMEYMRVQKGAL